MSDDTPGPSDASTDTASEATTSPTPSPRPRSAASRARRIGGAAASPRPDTTPAPKTDADAPTVALGKKAGTDDDTGKPVKTVKNRKEGKDGKADGSAKAEPAASRANKSGSSRDAVTFSLPGWARWAPTVVFAAVAVVFLTLFAVAHIGGDDPPSSTSNTMRDEVLAAAKTCLATLNTYRYDQIDAAEKAGVACTTGKLTSDYRRTVSTVIRKNAPPLQAVQVAKINTAGIESVTANGKQWTILAYGQLNITNVNQKTGRQDPFAVVARMEQVKGKWVIAKVDTVSSFAS